MRTVTAAWRVLRASQWAVEAQRGHGSPGTPSIGRRPSVQRHFDPVVELRLRLESDPVYAAIRQYSPDDFRKVNVALGRQLAQGRGHAPAIEAMHEAVRGIRPFTLHLGKYTSLEKGSHGRTAVMEVLGDLGELTAMHESLESALYDRGFSRERKKFVPHITLGRSVEQDDLTAMELKNSIRANASLTVQAITLFESRREKGEMVYIPLHREKI